MAEYEETVTIDTIRPKFWSLRKPFALSAEGWQDWNEIARNNFPIRYWIQEKVSLWFRVKWMRIKDVKWWFLHRFHPKHRYNVVDTGLPPGYYDVDTLMLHSVFNLFHEFMKRQHSPNCHVDWTCDEHIEEWTEMNEIWEWWKQRDTREERFEQEHPHPDLPEEWGFLSVCNRRYDEHPIMIEWKKVSRMHTEQEVNWNREDEEMLIRVMKLRLRLWD